MDYKNMIFKHQRVHFIGVGGVSMCELARYLHSRQVKVSGSDIRDSDNLRSLIQLGIPCQVGHRVDLVQDAFIVVVNCAIDEDNAELQYARRNNIEVVTRAELLGEVCKDFDKVIAVAGCHGKTTTATMIYSILRAHGERVSCHIGASLPDARMEYGDEYLVVEACEYKRSFLSIKPFVAVITNVERDHLDYYTDLDDIQSAFGEFVTQAQHVIVGDNMTTEFLGLTRSDVAVQGVRFDTTNGRTEFSVVTDRCLPVSISTLGRYNVDNAVLAIRTAWALGQSDRAIVNGLADFVPVARRSQTIGLYRDADVVIDYAHHPTEIDNFHNLASSIYHEYVFVFQPHTYSRTKALLDDFVRVLKDIPNLIIYKEYPARESESQGMSAKSLVKVLRQNKVKCSYVDSLTKLNKALDNYNADAYLFVGAGDIDQLAKSLVSAE
ncbi:MAG: UDP-N-acetylmuramate--L-alanine ligase [Clostridia bacterium]|nr:UDP-N-acetylmuramate--L-alanine ligase [Clostridia bacterium]